MKFYDLLSHCIPASMVLRTLTFKLVAKVDEELKGEIVKWSAFYEHRIKMGSVSTPLFSSLLWVERVVELSAVTGLRKVLIISQPVESHLPPRSVRC
jgi:hypothetical protein